MVKTVQQFGEGGKLQRTQTTVADKNGKIIDLKDTQYTYGSDGKLAKTKITKANRQNQTKEVIEQTYDEQGKITQQNKTTTTVKNKKKLTSKSSTNYEYDENNQLKRSVTKGKDQTGKPQQTIAEFEGGKKVRSHSKFYAKGSLTETITDYKTSAAGVPTTKIIYGKDGKTLQERIDNTFDSDGILSGQKVTNANGKVTNYDYSKLDGKFDIGNQEGRGNCYFLASVNALRETSEGQQMLQQIITESVDENGKKVYTVTFPGAKMAREGLINGDGDKAITLTDGTKVDKLPVDKVKIQDSYTITEDELKAALKQQGKRYSLGDRDVVLLEVGFEKYRQSVNDTMLENKVDPNKNTFIAGVEVPKKRLGTNDVLSSGCGADALFILTGHQAENVYIKPKTQNTPTCYINSDMSVIVVNEGQNLTNAAENTKAMGTIVTDGTTNNIDTILDKLEKDCADGKLDEYASTAGFNVSQQEVNGEVVLGGGHEFTITKVTADTVEMRNPWDPAKTVTMSKEDFKKACKNIYMTPLHATQEQPQTQPLAPTPNTPATPQPQQPPQTQTTHPQQQQTAHAEPHRPQKPNYKVPQGMSYTRMIKNALIKQGIQNPTKEQIAKAKEQFVAANPEGTVHTYNGKNKAYIGNKFLMANANVFIPKFNV